MTIPGLTEEQGNSAKKVYVKYQSFDKFVSLRGSSPTEQMKRALAAIVQASSANLDAAQREVIEAVRQELAPGRTDAEFRITTLVSDELAKIEDDQILRYLYHRYRYDIFPKKKILDKFPPYLQIEPSSICNFRCVFCYQTDESFTQKSSGQMGTMSYELFRDIIDQIEGKVDFISIASRGEPLVCRDIDKMLAYCTGKFLGLKVNTNASLLDERRAHAILSGGVNTVVFSADAAEEPLYSQLRVGGTLEKTLSNIRLFNTIRQKEYSHSKIITRVSGVKVKQEQNMDSMLKVWSDLVDQVCFVDYNPWENVYESPVNDLATPCSDLWRRMFVWYDGKVNPCDTDYKSTLSVGGLQEKNISQVWRSSQYEALRERHLQTERSKVDPCRRCVVV